MLLDTFYQLKLFGKCLVHSCLFRNFGDSSVENLDIGKDQFQIDRLNITRRIDIAVYVDDIRIFKAAYHMYDRIYFTDIGKKLVAKTFSLAGTLYESCNINEFDRSRSNLLCMI